MEIPKKLLIIRLAKDKNLQMKTVITWDILNILSRKSTFGQKKGRL